MNKIQFDIIIIGGGHAGCEAAWAASQFSLKVGLISMKGVSLASAPCNPAIGGVGKGQVVRELDALGGLMPMLADYSGIQYRTLNESKGAAVRSTRVQIDKETYTKRATELLLNRKNLKVVRSQIIKVKILDSGFELVASSGQSYLSPIVIITTGTFLNGKLHVGQEQVSGGRISANSSVSLRDLVIRTGTLKRFKTGTPPRISKSSIDFSKMEEQLSDPASNNFHFANSDNTRNQKQLSCYLTRTNANTLNIIRKNKEKSPVYNGQIEGIGPRYCPSIEDKAFRYPDKNIHHVFVEPEGLDLETFYPNGISTSLPIEIQEAFVQTITGLESALISIPGYAVEYDVVDTTQLSITLEHNDIKGLYFAGQLNGTSGYEEAAGQGYISGINAALSGLGRDKFVLDRNSSYIGVMIEDLVTCERDEPYRLFTARSESRLYNREDNTYYRLSAYRKKLGLDEDIDKFLERYLSDRAVLIEIVKNNGFRATSRWINYFEEHSYGKIQENITLEELIKRSHLDPEKILKKELLRMGLEFIPTVVQDVANTLKYAGYLARSLSQQKKVSKLNNRLLKWQKLTENSNISFECRQRIKKIRPETFQQLSKINGIRPATLAYVASSSL